MKHTKIETTEVHHRVVVSRSDILALVRAKVQEPVPDSAEVETGLGRYLEDGEDSITVEWKTKETKET